VCHFWTMPSAHPGARQITDNTKADLP